MPSERSEILLLLMTLNAQINIHEVAYFAHEDGIIGDPQWERILQGICQARSFLIGSTLERAVDGRLTNDFANYVNESCQGFIGARRNLNETG